MLKRPDVRGKMAKLPEFSINGPHSEGIVLETIKRGEDDTDKGENSVVLRMHEVTGGRAAGELKL